MLHKIHIVGYQLIRFKSIKFLTAINRLMINIHNTYMDMLQKNSCIAVPLFSPPPVWPTVAPPRGRLGGGNEVSDPEVTLHRLLDPASLHLPASRHNDKTVIPRGRGGGGGGGEWMRTGGARKVEQIRNGVFRGDIWEWQHSASSRSNLC